MSDVEDYELLILGGGKAGKTLAMAHAGRRVAMVERCLTSLRHSEPCTGRRQNHSQLRRNRVMSQGVNLDLARRFLKSMAERAAPGDIAMLFSEDLRFEIPGDENVLPWIGRKTGRSAIVDFIMGLRTLTEPIKFEVSDVLASDTRAVILVDFATRIKATGQTIVSSAAIVLEISGGAITRFLMIEDSFEVSRRARS